MKPQTRRSLPFLLPKAEVRSHLAKGIELGQVSSHILEADCLEVLPALPEGCIDLIHTSPPYNINKAYSGISDSKGTNEYREFIGRVAEECFRVLKPSGSFFFQVGYSESDGSGREILPIDYLTYENFRQAGFRLWDRIVWHYFGGMSFTRKFKNSHEVILWWVKPGAQGLAPFFDVNAVREEARSYDKRNNLWGRNPGNVWLEDRVAFGGLRRSTSHIAVYPESIAERVVRACSRRGEVVLDPFAGSGTTPTVARSLGREWIGIELSPTYAEEAAHRVGSRQSSEWECLAAGIVKYIAFDNVPGGQSQQRASERLDGWWQGVRVREYEERLATSLSRVRVEDLGAQVKNAKPAVWAQFDEFFRSAKESPVVVCSELLDGVFRQRRLWNGVRKYRHTVEALGEVGSAIEARGWERLMVRLARSEPSSFALDGSSIEFLGPPAAVGRNRQSSRGKRARRSSQGELLLGR